jgi:hypothetical protein
MSLNFGRVFLVPVMALGLIAPDLALAGIASPQRQITESSITVPGYELAQTKR